MNKFTEGDIVIRSPKYMDSEWFEVCALANIDPHGTYLIGFCGSTILRFVDIQGSFFSKRFELYKGKYKDE